MPVLHYRRYIRVVTLVFNFERLKLWNYQCKVIQYWNVFQKCTFVSLLSKIILTNKWLYNAILPGCSRFLTVWFLLLSRILQWEGRDRALGTQWHMCDPAGWQGHCLQTCDEEVRKVSLTHTHTFNLYIIQPNHHLLIQSFGFHQLYWNVSILTQVVGITYVILSIKWICYWITWSHMLVYS